MASVIVPFRAGGKTRLSVELRVELALAMLGDVLAAAVQVAPTRVVTADPGAALVAGRAGAVPVDDPGRGQGAAVEAGLAGCVGPVVVLNADVPCAKQASVRTLLHAAERGAMALVEARDGTTNALALPAAGDFRPLYGSGSAARFRAHGREQELAVLDLSLRDLQADVDTVDDLERVGECAGSRTRALLSVLLA